MFHSMNVKRFQIKLVLVTYIRDLCNVKKEKKRSLSSFQPFGIIMLSDQYSSAIGPRQSTKVLYHHKPHLSLKVCCRFQVAHRFLLQCLQKRIPHDLAAAFEGLELSKVMFSPDIYKHTCHQHCGESGSSMDSTGPLQASLKSFSIPNTS